MAKLNQNPRQGSLDNLQPSRYKITIDRIPDVIYFGTTLTLPGINIGEAVFPTPFIDMPIPGDKLTYDTITMTFLVDEDLNNWLQMFDWIKGIAFPKTFDQFSDMLDAKPASSGTRPHKNYWDMYSDATISVLTNKSNLNLEFDVKDLWPVSLGLVQFDNQTSDETPIICDCSFRFRDMEYKRIG